MAIVPSPAAAAAQISSRSWGSRCPSTSRRAAECFAATGFTFLFAPYYHPAMKALAPIRSALGVRTVFNLLGPLTNPAAPRFRLIGAYDEARPELIADTLVGMGASERGWCTARKAGMRRRPSARSSRSTWPRDGFAATHHRSAGVRLAAVLGRGSQGRRRRRQLRRAASGVRRAGSGTASRALVLQSGLALHIAGRAGSPAAGIALAGDDDRRGRAQAMARAAAAIRARGARAAPRMTACSTRCVDRAWSAVRQATRREPPARSNVARAHAPSAPPLCLSPSGFDVIAELKLRSPAAGALHDAGRRLAAGASRPMRVPVRPRCRCSRSRRDSTASLEHLREAAEVLGPLGRAGHAQGLSGRSLSGARGAGGRRGRGASHRSHVGPRTARRALGGGGRARLVRAAWRLSMSAIWTRARGARSGPAGPARCSSASIAGTRQT